MSTVAEQSHIRGKQQKVVALLERRILHGDYQFGPIPTERYLAEELKTSRVTLRKAIDHLAQNGLIVRQSNGRLIVNQQAGQKRVLQVAYLSFAHSSHANNVGRQTLEQIGAELGIRVRPVDFVHWDDPVINETLDGFDGVFLHMCSESVPAPLLQRLASGECCPTIMLEYDFSEMGIRSVVPWSSQSVHYLLDHLYSLGHRNIGCFNTQPHDPLIEQRFARWRIWMAAHGLAAPLETHPVESYQNAMHRAYREMTVLLKEKRHPEVTVWFCTTGFAALGAIRAAHDVGFTVGKDLSICALDGEGMNEFYIPSITCVERPDMKSFLRICLEWMQAGAKPSQWVGPLRLAPEEFGVFKGESVAVLANEGNTLSV